MSVTLAHARALHALGLSVVPLHHGTKKACVPWEPFQTARCTDADLVEWFGGDEDRNLGIVTGTVSGVVVIESDSVDAEARCATHLPDTPMKTKSARGVHRYYRVPTALLDAPHLLPAHVWIGGVDVELKRDGQYVVGPGSLHPTGVTYETIGDWPTTLDDVPELPLAVFPQTGPRRASAPPLPQSIGGGHRNTTLWTEACRLRRLGLDRAEIDAALQAINTRRCAPPLDRDAVADLAARAGQYTPASDTFPPTEAGDAEFFASLCGDTVRHDHRRQRWLVFNGHVWVPDHDGRIDRLALESTRARQRAAVGHSDKQRLQWASKGESRARLSNLLKIAASLEPITDDGAHWDEDPYLLGVQNGIVDLRTGTLRDGRPDDRITMRCVTPFDPHATCPHWEKFLAEVFQHDGEMLAYVQRACGYSLTGDCQEEVLFFCYGDGANGKGTLMNTFAATVGDYADDLPFSALTLHDRPGIPNDVAKLVGKRFVTASESGETTRLHEARVKALTGRDPITARFLHAEFFTFQPVAKFWLATNKKPIVRDDTHGFWRRLHLIPFKRSFVGSVDRTLKDRLRTEAAGILAWTVRGCLEWQRVGLVPPDAVLSATEEYRKESDTLTPFYEACCVIDPNARVQAQRLYDRYLRWCADTRVWPELQMTQKQFGQQVRARFPFEEKRHTTYIGIGLREDRQNDIPF